MAHIRRFDHVGLTVSDLDVATTFFVGLGFEVVPADESARGPLRQRWKQYQALGYALNKHDM